MDYRYKLCIVFYRRSTYKAAWYINIRHTCRYGGYRKQYHIMDLRRYFLVCNCEDLGIWVNILRKKGCFQRSRGILRGRIFTLIVETVMMNIGVQALSINENPMKIIASVVVLVLNYVISKLFVFKKTAWSLFKNFILNFISRLFNVQRAIVHIAFENLFFQKLNWLIKRNSHRKIDKNITKLYNMKLELKSKAICR